LKFEKNIERKLKRQTLVLNEPNFTCWRKSYWF